MPTFNADSLLSSWTPASVGLLLLLVMNVLPTFISRMVRAFKGLDVPAPQAVADLQKQITDLATNTIPPELAGQVIHAAGMLTAARSPAAAAAVAAAVARQPISRKTNIANEDTMLGQPVPNVV